VIATDIFPELVPYIESGNVFATLNQRPFSQGKTAFELLVRYLVDGSVPKPVTSLAPDIVLRSNLALFVNQ
jgi:LacI family transcriptional regulator